MPDVSYKPPRGRSRALKRRSQSPWRRFSPVLALSAIIVSFLALSVWAMASRRGGWAAFGTQRSRASAADTASDTGTDTAADTAADTGTDGRPSSKGGCRVDLGHFAVDRFDPITDTTLVIDFELEARTRFEDEASLWHFMEGRHRDFRREVAGAVRFCDEPDLWDADSLSRKIVTRVNRALGRRFLKSATVKELAVYEAVGTYRPALREPPQAEGP